MDLRGKQFGKLKVITSLKGKPYRWKCECSCGKIKIVQQGHLRNGGIKSCGCLRISHNMSKTRFYLIYRGIVSRCRSVSDKRYSKYGAKGIKCLWNTFEDFKSDMYKSYLEHIKAFGESETTLDRRNNEESYSSKNCRWATWKEQAQNRGTNRNLTFEGETKCISEWARHQGMKIDTLYCRIQDGWSIEKALTTPVRGN